MSDDTQNTSRTRSPEPPATDDMDTLKSDIEDARDGLGATVDELSGRLDVRKQAKAKAQDVQQTVSERPAATLGAVGAVAAAIGALVLGIVARKHRKKKTGARLRRKLSKR